MGSCFSVSGDAVSACARRVATALAAAARRFLVLAALLPAARRFRVLTALLAATRRFRVVAAFFAATRRLRLAAPFFPDEAIINSFVARSSFGRPLTCVTVPAITTFLITKLSISFARTRV